MIPNTNLNAFVAVLVAGFVIQPTTEAEDTRAQRGFTPNEKAANGPFPGDLSLYEKELELAANHASPGYYPSLNAAEVSDAMRSAFFPAASFTGSWDGPNQVYAWRSATKYQGCTYIGNRKPGELYIIGGDFPPPAGPLPPGPYIAKADATTGKEIWRTYVDNGNLNDGWIANGNLNILANGNIPFSWGTQIVLIDGDDGRILRHNRLPAGAAKPQDVNYKHVTVAPDGILIVKNQTRPQGEKSQGSMAIINGVMKGLKQSKSHMCAVHPETLEILSEIGLPEATTAPHIINEEDGKTAIYVPTVNFVLRYHWDGQKLSRDEAWTMKPMRDDGQETATAPTVVGDWIAVQTNGSPTPKVTSSIAVAHRKDVNNIHIIRPFGKIRPGEWSFCPPKPGADPENNMIYSADAGLGKTAGIKLDPETGKMETVFVIPARSTAFQPVIGPKDKRVLIVSNMKLNAPEQPIMAAVQSVSYTEQVTWWDAAKGRQLAASDYFSPMTLGSLITPGFGGRVYFINSQDFTVLQPLPAADKFVLALPLDPPLS